MSGNSNAKKTRLRYPPLKNSKLRQSGIPVIVLSDLLQGQQILNLFLTAGKISIFSLDIKLLYFTPLSRFKDKYG